MTRSPQLKVTAISADKHASELEQHKQKIQTKKKVQKLLDNPRIQKLYY